MSEKKKPGRFTIQFNMEDPQQRRVSELLEQQGRRKAQFLTCAVLCYVQQPETQEQAGLSPTIDEAALERALVSVLEKHPQIRTTLSDVPLEPATIPAQTVPDTEPWNDAMGADALAAISETLSALQQG